MTNKLLKLLKETKEAFTQGFSEGFAKQTGHGISITLDHNMVRNAGCVFAMYATYTDGSSSIIVDDEFNIAPVSVRNFIIWHELGHIGNADATRNLPCEIKADAFAASKIGEVEAVEALRYMWRRLATIDVSACIDIPSRLKALGSNVDDMYIRGINGKVFYEPALRAILEGRYK